MHYPSSLHSLVVILMTRCRSFSIITLLCTVVDTIGSNVYLTTRLYYLWGRQKSIFYVLIAVLLSTHIPAMIICLTSVKMLSDNMAYNTTILECVLSAKPVTLIAAWALVVAFDIIQIALIAMNALDRPRHRDAELWTYLKSDSATFYIGLLLMRFVTLVLLIILPPATVFIYIFFITWPLTSAALSRFILSSEAFKYSAGTRGDYLTYEMETRRWQPTVLDKQAVGFDL
ncbi:hypothetical protein BDY19DRAFT_776646 [Irpex rosettiformis]|uniref:Uncharacterized protein n=1 Tax=Irpex rosettiformis TaxID=378272 RepID=A0ACB8TM72_9APHY|nr:hypothetical protein BDY19DRAFT_776646 [Irpex rosettiformis]